MYLSPEQKEMIPAYKEKWVEIGLSTAPMEIEAAIKHLGDAYKISKLKRPAGYLFYGSPIAGSYVSAYLKRHYQNSILKLFLYIRENKLSSRDELEKAVERFKDCSYACRHKSSVLTLDQQSILSDIFLNRAKEVIPKSTARNELSNAMFGQHEAGWLGFYEALRDFGIAECRKLTPMIEFAKCAAWTWAYDDVAIITDRPMAFHRDEIGRPHCETGPALAYRDGVVLYALHGVTVPRFVIEEPEKITNELIEKEPNAEVRRVMLERFGWSRYLMETNSEILDEIKEEDAEEATDIRLARLYRCGLRGASLYRKTIPGDEDLVMIKLINSTPEPDGSLKPYLLRVPPTTKNCLEAVAWINWKQADDYRPGVES